MESCQVNSPYTLLGFVLDGGGVGVGGFASRGFRCFSMRDYFARVTNFLLWISLVAVTYLLSRKLARLLRLWAGGSRIPGPSLFAGHSKLVGHRGSPQGLIGYLSDLHEKYGPVVRVWLGPTQLIVSVKDVTIIKEMLIKAKDRLPLMGRTFRLAFGRSNIFVSSFEKAQEERECLSEHINERLLERLNLVSLKVVDCVLGRVESAASKGILDCQSISRHISFYILGAMLLEEAFLDWSDVALYEDLLYKIMRDSCFWSSYKVPPFWKREYWRYRLLLEKLKHLTGNIIQQYSSLEDGKEHPILTVDPCGDILGLMFHGCVTISNLVCSILSRLALQPELQEKIFLEIKEVQERTLKQDPYDVQKMHFLLATVYESARILPPSPLLQRCSLKRDLCLKSSVIVPAGAVLVVPLQLVQVDNSDWGDDACQFNPQRFISNSNNQTEICEEDGICGLLQTAAYIPFGSGSRACIGQKSTILGISTLFASLLRDYEIRLMDDVDLDFTTTDPIYLLPNPKIAFVRRNNR